MLSVILVLCLQYILYHNESGSFGMNARNSIEKDIKIVREAIEDIEDSIKTLQYNVNALGNYPDNDTLDQSARQYLYYANPEEYIIITE